MSLQNAEILGRVRTKIVATLGPASSHPAMVLRLVEAGVDCFRLNASHTAHAERTQLLVTIRSVSEEIGHPVGVLLDLGGPKIRLGPLVDDAVECPQGAIFRLTRSRVSSAPNEFTCTLPELCSELKRGDPVLFADGTVAMEVTDTDAAGVTLAVTLPGRLRSGQGLNLPGAALKVAALTEADLADLDWLRENPVEYVGLSFARTAADVEVLRSELTARGCQARIVTKIEKPQAVQNFSSILAVTDAVMIARGDLGVEMDVARVPAIQKQILTECQRARVPVITATQMLQSMERSNRPSRAEASDVFNAVVDGTDAVMLSGETAIGEYPIETVRTMSRIVSEAEKFLPQIWRDPGPISRGGWITPTTEAVVEAASATCRKLGAALLVVATHSGRTALAVSKQRGPTPTLALVDNLQTARISSLYWGVTPLYVPTLSNLEHALEFALTWARQHELVHAGDCVVMIRGTIPGSTVHNALVVEHVT
jgi:pyruvate kinase